MLRTILLTLLVLALAIPVHAKPKQSKFHQPDSATSISAKNAFSSAERNLIRAQLAKHERASEKKRFDQLPPGLQKKVARGKALPPGWQKKVTPGHSLDYQVYRQRTSLPEEILRRLPTTQPGSEIIQVEDKIIRLNTATRTILDAFDLVPMP